jgi:signal transduction histidine kinase
LHGTDGRLVLIKAQEAFSLRDRTFLTQCAKALGVVAANACLTDELIASAADDERLTICRDLHDTAVQPYLGLKLALEAMARDFAAQPAVVERVHRVKSITEAAVEELRTYTANLRGRTVAPATSVRAAIERHAARLGRFYGLQVAVCFDPELRIEGRIAEAIFQLVAEALSNVLRHTASRRARVDVGSDGRVIMVQVANRWPEDSPKPPPFVPRSIEERALELGGRVRIRMNDDRWTLVDIELPDRCAV